MWFQSASVLPRLVALTVPTGSEALWLKALPRCQFFETLAIAILIFHQEWPKAVSKKSLACKLNFASRSIRLAIANSQELSLLRLACGCRASLRLNGGLANAGWRCLSTIVHDCLELSSVCNESLPEEALLRKNLKRPGVRNNQVVLGTLKIWAHWDLEKLQQCLADTPA